MNQQIKQRIEQINNGQVPEGYKKTEFGIFPSDWVTDKKLKDIGSFDKGRGLPGDKMCDSGVPCVGYGDIYMKYNNFHFEKAENFVDEETASESLPIKKGTLLFTGTGETAEEIGKCVCYNGDETIYAGGDIITFKTNEVNPLFLAYQQYQSYSLAKKASFGQGHSVVHIHANNLEKLNVAYPKSTAEQEKIAEILIKWDKAIELQEKYIEKLAEKRKYIFHSLFLKNDNWTCKKLQNVINVLSGYAFKSETYVEDGKYLIITIANVNDNRFAIDKNTKKVNSIPKDIREYQKLQINDIIMSLTGNVARICKVSSKNCLLNQRVAKIEVKKEYDKDFVFYLLQTFKFSEYMKMYAQGAAQDNLSVKDIYRLQVYLPKTIEEQNAISKKLSTYDLILKNEDKKLNLLKQQRKALQQYLLNGIVRVER